MNIRENIDGLRGYNKWRRGAEIGMLSPKYVGELIDNAVDNLEVRNMHEFRMTRETNDVVIRVRDNNITWEDLLEHIFDYLVACGYRFPEGAYLELCNENDGRDYVEVLERDLKKWKNAYNELVKSISERNE
jgi:hypothetical protein